MSDRSFEETVDRVRAAVAHAGFVVSDELRVTAPERVPAWSSSSGPRVRLEVAPAAGSSSDGSGTRLLVLVPEHPGVGVVVTEGDGFLARVPYERPRSSPSIGALVRHLRSGDEEPYVSNADYRRVVELASAVERLSVVGLPHSLTRLLELREVRAELFEVERPVVIGLADDLAAGVPVEWALRRLGDGADPS